MTQGDVVYSVICIKNVFLIHSLQSSFRLGSGLLTLNMSRKIVITVYHLDKMDHFVFICFLFSAYIH